MTQFIALEREQLLAIMAVLIPQPTPAQVETEFRKDQTANPHGDVYKPRLRGFDEIIAYLRVQMAKDIMHEMFVQSSNEVK